MKKLGVIGGLGPMASVYFYELLTKMTNAVTDQEHIDILLYSCPSIPDRTAYITKKSEKTPLPPIIDAGNALVRLGVDYIAIPCITAHYFYDEIAREVGVPIIHIIKETALYLREAGIGRVGLMATDGTILSGVFQAELAANGIEVFLPSEESQRYVMEIIFDDVKAGRPVDLQKFVRVSDELAERGADKILLACTELSLIKRECSLSGCIDALEVLAQKSLLLCGAAIREVEYAD